MRTVLFVGLTLAASATLDANAADLASTCHASSSYDLTVGAQSLLFDRAGPAPRKLELRDGRVVADGAALVLNTEDSDRIALFERSLRALLPKARGVASEGIDLAIRSVRAETATLQLGADAQAELEAALAARATDLKRRVATSTSTHDWQGEAFDHYADDIAAEIVPIVATDLGQQALAAAVGGDLDEAAALRDRAAHLAATAKPRIEQRMQALRPKIQALCPDIRQLYELQHGVRGAKGAPLDLLDIDAR